MGKNSGRSRLSVSKRNRHYKGVDRYKKVSIGIKHKFIMPQKP